LAARIDAAGMHIVIYFESPDLPELYDFIAAIPAIVVVDHMGRPDLSKPVSNSGFSLFLKLMAAHENIWCKTTCPERLSHTGPPTYDDFVPFSHTIISQFPDRVLWGTDWPHPNLKTHMPDDAWLVDMIPRIAPTKELQRKLLVDNPMRLYWPEEGE
jgi:2-pyrone-4,6-dicarboxylate lactonase